MTEFDRSPKPYLYLLLIFVVRDDSHKLLPGGVMLVSPIVSEDTGEYTCTATNNLGTASASSFGL